MDTQKYLETFQGSKPQRFAPMINVLPNKSVNLDFADALVGKLDTLSDSDLMNASTRESAAAATQDDTSTLPPLDTKAKRELTQQIANVKAFRQLALFHSFSKFLPNAKKAHIELMGTKGNYEDLRNDKYIDLRSALNAAFWNSEKEFIKNRRLRGQSALTKKEAESGNYAYQGFFGTDDRLDGYIGLGTPSSGDFFERNIYGQNPQSNFGAPLTNRLFSTEKDSYLHNLNLYNGADNWEIFKKQDQKNSKIFNENKLFSPIVHQFMSPLTALSDIDPNFVNKMQTENQSVRNTQRESFRNANEANDNHNLNWENAPDPYTDNDVNTFDINAGYYELGMSQVLASTAAQNSFYMLVQMAEDRKRISSVQSDILKTKIFDLPNPGGTAEEAKKRADQLVKNAIQSYEDVTQNIGDESIHIGMNLITGASKDIDDMIGAWGSWGDSGLGESAIYMSAEQSQVRDNLINGYLDHLTQTLIPQIAKPQAISVEHFAKFGQAGANFIIQDLVDKNIIDKKGAILAPVNDPNYTLPMLDQDLGHKVLQILKQQSNRQFSLERPELQNVKLIDPATQKGQTLEEINALLNKGDTPLEKYINARKVYNTYFDMFESMTGLGLKTGASNGKVVGQQVGDTFQVTVYPNASFDQYELGQEGPVSMGSKSGEPLVLTFSNEDEANIALRQVRVMIASLEPMLSMFAPSNSNGPGVLSMTYEGGEPRMTTLRVLTDNAGSMNSINTITEVDDNYQLQVDVLSYHDDGKTAPSQSDDYQAVKGFHRTYFKDENSFAKRIHDEVGLKSLGEVVRKMNEKMAVNRMLRVQHERKWKEFEEEFEKHVEEEFRKEVEDIKSYLKARAAQEEREKLYEKLRKEAQERDEMLAQQRSEASKKDKNKKK